MLRRFRVKSAAEVTSGADYVGTTVKMAGAIESYGERKSRVKNRPFGVFGLSDASGGFEVMVFEDSLESARLLVEKGEPIVLDVEVRQRPDDDAVRLSAKGMMSLETVAAQSDAGLEIYLGNGKVAPIIAQQTERHKGGRGRSASSCNLPMAVKRQWIYRDYIGSRLPLPGPLAHWMA